MNPFKVGDYVKVVNNGGAFDTRSYGEVLEVKYVEGEFVGFSFDSEASWDYDRFATAEKPVENTVIVRTREQVQADRRKELLDGVVAYHAAGKEVPREWIEELYCARYGIV